MPDEEFRPGAHDLETPFLFVPHGAPDPMEWKRQHPGWVSFPATFVPHPRPIPKWKVINGRRWPLDKKGRPWPRTRYGHPTCPFDELPPGFPAPGTQDELMRKLENPTLFWEGEPAPTVEEFSALATRLRAERAAAAPPPIEPQRAHDGDGLGPVRDYMAAMKVVDQHLREFAAAARQREVAQRNAEAIQVGMDQARAAGTGGGVQVAQLALPAAVPPPPVVSDAVPPAIGQVQLDRMGRRLGYVADEIGRGELSDAAAHLLLGKPYPPEVDDPPLGKLVPPSGFTPPMLPDQVDPGFDIDPDAGRPSVLATPAAPQAGPDIEGFDPPSTDPATVFERSELRRNMEKAGKIEREDSRVGHHIVPGGGPMSGGRDATPSQKLLEELEIDRNSAHNGVALSPGFHAKIHTEKYYDTVREQLEDATSKERLMEQLQTIGERLQEADRIYQQTGRLPSWIR